MKLYTDLEQAKRLVKFLPLESADMYYHNRVNIPDNFPLPIEWKRANPLLSQEIPCWSLAALLRVLPYPELREQYNGNWTCKVSNAEKTYLWEDDNPIDVCVAMIIKLHEQKLL